jgi:hypothetical protein
MAKGYSLHLGLNFVDPKHYGGWDGELAACEFDANDMAAIAKAQGHAETTVLLTREATSGRLVKEMLRLARVLEADDLLFLTYSGHGGQVPAEGSDEDDKLDETWCLYDRQFIDNEIYNLLGRFRPGVRIVTLSDSCHSGTALRDRQRAGGPSPEEQVRSMARAARETMPADAVPPEEDAKPRLAPIDVTLDNYNENKDVYLALQAATAGAEGQVPAAGAILISGCQDAHVSLDGRHNGLFTGNLKKVWKEGAFDGGYRAFHQAIVARMPPTQVPNLFQVGNVTAAFLNRKPFTV